jgi:RNA polymerase sigma-70 factor (ECF subfamily)
MTDNQIIELMNGPSDIWQRALYDEYCRYVYTIAANNLRCCGTAEDIEECVADIFIDIFCSIQSEKAYNNNLKYIISTIAKRNSIDLFRRLSLKNKRTVPIDELTPNYEPSENNLESTSERKELKVILIDCVNKLGDPDSSIIIDHYYYGRSSGEIASEHNMTAYSVQKRIQRARKKLKNLLFKAGVDAEW